VSRPDLPLDGLAFALVGPGRVGTSLGEWARAAGAVCRAVAGRGRSAELSLLAGRWRAVATTAALWDAPDVDLVLIAVPDAAIPEVARHLAGRLRSGVVLHTAGALGPSALAPLAAVGRPVGCLHPLRAFPTVEPDLAAARGTFYALDGDAQARALGRRLAGAFGGDAAVVTEAVRPVYHLAASFAAGGVTTLFASAVALARAGGVPAVAFAGYARLAAGALEMAAAAPDPADAITGPAARGDLETVERQLAALRAVAPAMTGLAVAVARAALDRQAERGPLSPSQKALAEWLDRPDLLDRTKDPVLTSDSSD
jgi:predicted short-subunit dehydrogenase-like oxidoreductase (DUF2520 family)